MKNSLATCLFAVLFFLIACQGPKKVVTEQSNYIKNANKLIVKISDQGATGNSLKYSIKFEVINETDKPIRFCKWETPFEPKLGKYFVLVDEQGNEAPFKGAMARRMMPPPPDAFLTVPAHDHLQVTTKLTDNYELNKQRYKLTYVGSNISGLIFKGSVDVKE